MTRQASGITAGAWSNPKVARVLEDDPRNARVRLSQQSRALRAKGRQGYQRCHADTGDATRQPAKEV